MLGTREILRALKSNNRTGPLVLGVFASDQLPADVPRPCCLVVNTDPASKPGEHWVAIFINSSGILDYFDSYGLSPQVPSIIKWISENSVAHSVNKECVQSYMTATCGQHCIFFLLWRCGGQAMHRIVGMLTVGCERKPLVIDCFVNGFLSTKTVT